MNTGRTLHVDSDVIKPVSVVRDLGVLLDQELSMKQHISKCHSSSFDVDGDRHFSDTTDHGGQLH